MVFGVSKHLADEPRRLSYVLVDDGRGDDLEEGGVNVVRHRARQQRLPRPRRAVEQHTLWRLYAHALEELGVDQRQFDDFTQLADLFIQATHRGVLDVARVLRLHMEHHRVHLARQMAHDCQRGHVERHSSPLQQLGLVDLVAAADHVTRATRCLNDEALAVKLPQHLPDDLPYRLQRLQVILSLVVVLFERLGLIAHCAREKSRGARGGA